MLETEKQKVSLIITGYLMMSISLKKFSDILFYIIKVFRISATLSVSCDSQVWRLMWRKGKEKEDIKHLQPLAIATSSNVAPKCF